MWVEYLPSPPGRRLLILHWGIVSQPDQHTSFCTGLRSPRGTLNDHTTRWILIRILFPRILLGSCEDHSRHSFRAAALSQALSKFISCLWQSIDVLSWFTFYKWGKRGTEMLFTLSVITKLPSRAGGLGFSGFSDSPCNHHTTLPLTHGQ